MLPRIERNSSIWMIGNSVWSEIDRKRPGGRNLSRARESKCTIAALMLQDQIERSWYGGAAKVRRDSVTGGRRRDGGGCDSRRTAPSATLGRSLKSCFYSSDVSGCSDVRSPGLDSSEVRKSHFPDFLLKTNVF